MQVTRIIPDVPSFLAGSMSFDAWSILFMVGQSLVIFLVVVMVAAIMIVYERRMLALMARSLRSKPCRTLWFVATDRGYAQNLL